MRRAIIAAGLLLTFATPALPQAKQDFELVNKTGYEISEVYISPSKRESWEEDVLGDGSLDDGESRTIRFSNSGNVCKWDLKVVYEDDDSAAYWRDINLCQVSKVTIRYDRKKDTTSASFD